MCCACAVPVLSLRQVIMHASTTFYSMCCAPARSLCIRCGRTHHRLLLHLLRSALLSLSLSRIQCGRRTLWWTADAVLCGCAVHVLWLCYGCAVMCEHGQAHPVTSAIPFPVFTPHNSTNNNWKNPTHTPRGVWRGGGGVYWCFCKAKTKTVCPQHSKQKRKERWSVFTWGPLQYHTVLCGLLASIGLS